MLLVFVLFLSIKTVYPAVNYKLSAIYYAREITKQYLTDKSVCLDQLEYISSWIGKRPGVIRYTTYWCSPGIPYLFEIRLPNIWNNKSIPLITWTLVGCDGSQQAGIEYGTTSVATKNVSNVQMKAEWLNQFCDYIGAKQVKMPSLFNLDLEIDWTSFGCMHGDTTWNNFNVYTAYKNCLRTYESIEVNSTNPRLLTDDQFAGRF